MSQEYHQPANESRWRRYVLIAVVVALLGIVFWTLGGRTMWTTWRQSQVPREIAAAFVRDLSNGDIEAARDKAGPLFATSGLRELSEKLESLGSFQDVSIFDHELSTQAGVTMCELQGTARFSQATRSFEISLIQQGEVWKVTDARFPS